MRDEEWRAIFGKLLVDAQKELADFKYAIANHGLRVLNNKQDVTLDHIRQIEDRIEEYRKALAAD
jgi:vacuolar-type H+-ATPase subunit D/Vma8